MASITWSGAHGSNAGLNSTRTIYISTWSDTSNLVGSINSLIADLTLRTNAYGSTYNLTIKLKAGTREILSQNFDVKLPGTGNQSFTAEFDTSSLSLSDIASIDAITLYAPTEGTSSNGTVRTLFSSEATQYIILDYTPISFTTGPGTPIITQNATTGLWSASWTPATLSNGSTKITYYLLGGGEQWDCGSATSISGKVPMSYDTNVWFYVYAEYDDDISICTESDYKIIAFQPPTLATPSITISPAQGDSTTITWTKPGVTYGTASSYSYFLQYNTSSATGQSYQSFPQDNTNTFSVIVPTSDLEDMAAEGEDVEFYLIVLVEIAGTLADEDYRSLAAVSSSKAFTFAGGKNTISYYNGTTWQECTVHYYNGSQWVECVPYYYTGSEWKELKR